MMQPREQLLLVILTATVAMILLHFAALEFYLYWMYWWFDMIVHFFGGLASGLAIFWIIRYAGRIPVASHLHWFLLIISAVLVIGIGWEIFELATGLYAQKNYVFDTTVDIVMDLLGGFIAFLLLTQTRLSAMIKCSHGDM